MWSATGTGLRTDLSRKPISKSERSQHPVLPQIQQWRRGGSANPFHVHGVVLSQLDVLNVLFPSLLPAKKGLLET